MRSRYALDLNLRIPGGEDWDPEIRVREEQPLPLVRRRAPPRVRTFAGVAAPVPQRGPVEVDLGDW